MVEYIHNQLLSKEGYGNPGSLHRLGRLAEKMQTNALERICDILDCGTKEFFFTSCGTESINTVLRGYPAANPRAGRHMITTRTEHKASLEVLQDLEKEGFEISWLPVDGSGEVDILELESMIRPDTALITLTYVNSETGSIQPLQKIVSVKNKINPAVKIHLDCVQALGKIPLKLRESGIDFASFSGHKIHCVKGIGGLYIRKGCRLKPLLFGGGQQNGIRSGTQSPYLYGAFALALEIMERVRTEAFNQVTDLRSELLSGLDSFNIQINSPEKALPYIVNLSFPDFQSETMLHALGEYEIYVSTVSACSSRKQKISYVLTEMGIPRDIASRAIRISFSPFSKREEVVFFCEKVSEIYRKFHL